MTYRKIDAAILQALTAIVGEKNIVTTRDEMEPYSHDETEDIRAYPEVVVKPTSTPEVSAIMRLCNDRLIPVTPRAGGTGLSGGAIPLYGGVLLSVERMNRILEIDRRNLMAVVEPAVVTATLQEEVERVGLFYPPDPASRESCAIGGNIAECAGGPRALKYGVTKDYVYGLEAVLPDGEIIRTGGKLLKNVTGYNLTQLLVGSEGTLAVITQATLKLLPLPTVRKTILAPFPSVQSAARAVTKIFLRGVVPCAVEFMERSAVAAAEKLKGESFPHGVAEAFLLIEADGFDDNAVQKEIDTICAVCLGEGAPDIVLALDQAKRDFLWRMRRAVGEAVKSISVYKEEDTVVPRAELPLLMTTIREVMERHGLTTICYGHAGDGNIHVNILKKSMSDEVWRSAIPIATRELFGRVVGLGGTISGEHGIGCVQREYLPLAIGARELSLMRMIKRVFDKNNILNPGKSLPD